MRQLYPRNREPGLPLALGIDPGLRGAIALVSKTWVFKILDLELALHPDPPHSLPITSNLIDGSNPSRVDRGTKRGSSKVRQINGSYHDPQVIVNFLEPLTLRRQAINLNSSNEFTPIEEGEIQLLTPKIIVIEDVASINPADSGTSMFKMGQVKGMLIGLVNLLFPEVPIKYLNPAVWKPHLALSKNKKKSLELAREIWKEQNHLFERHRDVDKAEASLLGYCGLKILE